MKILMIHPHDIFSRKEPWTSRIRNIAREHVARGHDVKIVYFSYYGEEGRAPSPDMFASVRLNRSRRWFFWNLFRIIQEARWADVIHFQKCFAHAALPALFAHVVANTPIHYDWDDWEYQIYNFSPPSRVIGNYLNYLERSIPALVDTMSAASDAIRDMAIELGFPQDRISDGHVCADLGLFNPDIDGTPIREKFGITKPIVMYMGQLHGGQYAHLFIKAAAEILNEHDVMFMIVGAGDREGLLYREVFERGLQQSVIFSGAVPYESVPHYLAAADVAVACFEDNNITRCKSPLKIVEYMAAGKAIVASDVGDVKKMLNGTGLLARPGDVGSLRDGIAQLLRDEESRKTMGIAARKNAEERYGWHVTSTNLLESYAMSMRN